MALAGDHVQVLVGAYELTGDHNRIAINDARDMLDVTAFDDEVHNFVPGKRTIVLEHAGYMNADTGRSHPVLKGATVEGVVSLLVGQNADPVAGDPVYSMDVRQGKYSNLPEIGKYIPFGAAFGARGNRGGWGVALAVPVTFTNTTIGSAVDGGASSNKGGVVYLHVLQAAASDTYSIVVEGADDSAFTQNVTTLATFELNASDVGSERQPITGTIPRYVRWKATRIGSAGNAVKVAVSFIRF